MRTGTIPKQVPKVDPHFQWKWISMVLQKETTWGRVEFDDNMVQTALRCLLYADMSRPIMSHLDVDICCCDYFQSEVSRQ